MTIEDMKKELDNKMNFKRVMALIGAVILACMYVATLVFAIIDDPKTMSFFKASVALTILVPVLLYAYQLVFRVTKSLSEGNKDSSDNN